LLHVIDASDTRMQETIAEVDRVIQEIGADTVPQVRVMNKIDQMADMAPHLDRDEGGRIAQVWVSAQTGAGLDLVADALKERLGGRMLVRDLHLGPADGHIRATLYRVAKVMRESHDEQGGWLMRVEGTCESLRFLESRPELLVS